MLETAGKYCGKCDSSKSFGEFRKNKSNKDGLDGYCRDCRLQYQHDNRERFAQVSRERALRWYYENRDLALANMKKYAEENKETVSSAKLAYYERNREEVKERTKRWIFENPERHRVLSANWKIENPERHRVLCANAQARRRARKTHDDAEMLNREIVWERDEGVCGICSQAVDYSDGFHLDHVIPLSKGGRHIYQNVQVAHPSCNFKKGMRMDFKILASSLEEVTT